MKMASLAFDEETIGHIAPADVTGYRVATKSIITGLLDDSQVDQWFVAKTPYPHPKVTVVDDWRLHQWDVWFEASDPHWNGPSEIRARTGAQFPIVSQVHAVGYRSVLSGFLECLALFPSHPGDTLICPSKAAKRVVEAFFSWFEPRITFWRPPRLAVVSHGVDVPPVVPKAVARELLHISKDELVVLFVGRLDPYDKADLFTTLLALTRLGETIPPWRLLIVGMGTAADVESLMRAARALGRAERVTVLRDADFTSRDIAYRAADVFVSLSHTVQETFGLTVAEAMTSGLPVVATAWDGYHDLVQDGVEGYLVPCNILAREWDWAQNFDEFTHLWSEAVLIDVDRLEAVLSKVLSQAEVRVRLSANAQMRARDLTRDAHIGRIKKVLLDAREQSSSVSQGPLPTVASPKLSSIFREQTGEGACIDGPVTVEIADPDRLSIVASTVPRADAMQCAEVLAEFRKGRTNFELTRAVRLLLKRGFLRLHA